MSESSNVDHNTSSVYGRRHPVPTIQNYRTHKAERRAEHEVAASGSVGTNASPRSTKSKRRSLLSSAKGLLRRDSTKVVPKSTETNNDEPYQAENRNVSSPIVRKDWAKVREANVPKAENVDDEGLVSDKIVQQDHFVTSTKDDTLQEKPHIDTSGKRLEQNDKSTTNDAASQKSSTSQPLESHEIAGGPVNRADEDDSCEHNNIPILTKISQAVGDILDPQQKRMDIKHMKRDNTDREVTDPVTHLPVEVHDFTDKELEKVPKIESRLGSEPRSLKGSSDMKKPLPEIEKDNGEQQSGRLAMGNLFPPPPFDVARDEIAGLYGRALTVGLAFVLLVPLILLVSALFITRSRDSGCSWTSVLLICFLLPSLGLVSGGTMILILRGRLKNQIKSLWDNLVWEAARKQELETSDSSTPESVQWLNSLLNSVWGLVNPDLFTSLVDTLEDVMQASLPKLVRMISVEDLGQGSEAIRILGVRWLPNGAAAQKFSQDGSIGFITGQSNDRKLAGKGQIENTSNNTGTSHTTQKEQGASHNSDHEDRGEDKNVAEGMEAEQGDFVNLEVAFSYRASITSKNLHDKLKNAHLYLAFYLPGGVKFPVWVELQGAVGIIRMRVQLCPDPPSLRFALSLSLVSQRLTYLAFL